MDWITDEVAIGNCLEARDAELLRRHGFKAVVSLDGTVNAKDAETLGLSAVASYRFIDGAGNDARLFRLAVDDLRRFAQSHPPVLVQCHAGRSRSAVVVAAYLMSVRRLDADAAVAAVRAKRSTNIAPELIEMLARYEA